MKDIFHIGMTLLAQQYKMGLSNHDAKFNKILNITVIAIVSVKIVFNVSYLTPSKIQGSEAFNQLHVGVVVNHVSGSFWE